MIMKNNIDLFPHRRSVTGHGSSSGANIDRGASASAAAHHPPAPQNVSTGVSGVSGSGYAEEKSDNSRILNEGFLSEAEEQKVDTDGVGDDAPGGIVDRTAVAAAEALERAVASARSAESNRLAAAAAATAAAAASEAAATVAAAAAAGADDAGDVDPSPEDTTQRWGL